ncbi:MAG: CZB domain-containing protein [Deltaproteobacteria bacterium]|nr:CZB domain-containing protein [Deltaproteobacteria bacterium]
MNFDDAIKAHSVWKTKLGLYLNKPDASLKPVEVEPDNRCDLGKWIHGEGAKHASLPEFGQLKETHRLFHQEAAKIVQRANNGEKVNEEVALGAKSGFGNASTKVITLLMILKSKT